MRVGIRRVSMERVALKNFWRGAGFTLAVIFMLVSVWGIYDAVVIHNAGWQEWGRSWVGFMIFLYVALTLYMNARGDVPPKSLWVD